MSLITAILQCHNSTPDNAGIIELVETLDNFRMKIREIETPKTGVEVTVEMNTDAPIHDEDDALRAVYEALAGLAIEVRTVVRGLCRFDEVAVDEFDAMEQRNADRYLLSI